jgi:hypothetical protein
MPVKARRSITVALVMASGITLAVLVLWYTFAMPTSDVRTRIYVLLAAAPWQLGGILFASLLLSGLAALWVAGLRDRWAVIGAVGGAALGVALVYSRLLGHLVWLHEEDVSRVGQYARAAVALGLAVGALLWARIRGSPRAAV